MKKYIIGLAICVLLEISGALYLTVWRENFWNAVSTKQSIEFLVQVCVFTAVALTMCLCSGITGYLQSITAIKWREILVNKTEKISKKEVENFSQRQQQDTLEYPDLYLQLLVGTGKALFYILVFGIALILSFSWWYVVALLVYAFIGTWVTKKVATPLIKLNYEQQRIEATYRQQLTSNVFKDCIFIMLGLAKKQKQLTYVSSAISQIGVVLPLILIAPEYFGSAMTLGLLMRFNSTASTILENLSYGVTNFATINKLLSCKRRLKEINIV